MSARRRWSASSLLLVVTTAFACTSPPPTADPLQSATSAAALALSGDPKPTPFTDNLPEVPPDPREQTLAEIATVLLSQKHLLKRPIDDALSKDAFPNYLDALDGAKLLLLQEHVDALTPYATLMDDELLAGDLRVARKGAALMQKRRGEVAKTIDRLLSKPFDFNVAGKFETDGKKRAYCKSEAELEQRWMDVLKLQALERLEQMDELLAAKNKPGEKLDAAAKRTLETIPATFELREEKVRKDLATQYSARFTRLASLEPLEPSELFLNALASAYDPHTQYLAPSAKEDFDIAISGKLEGIGAALGERDHYVVVQELIPGGASWQQGKLEAGDIILAVAQAGKDPVDVLDMPLDKVVSMVRGPKGTVVTLTVKKLEGKIELISITRDVIRIEASYARGAVLDLGPQQDSAGYIYLPSFYGEIGGGGQGERNATDDILSLIKELRAKQVSGLVIDLRGNGGGLLEHARAITGLFIPEGPVVQSRDSQGKLDILADSDGAVAFSGPVVVMVDRFSASASEILAGALQDYGRAVVVGTSSTHGKGSVQGVLDLNRLVPGSREPLGVFKLTMEQYFRINGDSTQWRGVSPDILLPDPSSFIDSGERTLPHSIPWTSVKPLAYSKIALPVPLDTLRAQSDARIKADPIFGRIEKMGQLIRTQRENSKDELSRKGWQEERSARKKALEAADPELKKEKARFSVVASVEAVKAAPVTDKKLKERLESWKEDLGRDPWLQQALFVVNDLQAKRP